MELHAPRTSGTPFGAGAAALGLNFVRESPRFIGGLDAAAGLIAAGAEAGPVEWAGVFVNAAPEAVADAARILGLAIVQLHGEEPTEQIETLRGLLPGGVRIWKAFRVAVAKDLAAAGDYAPDGWVIDAKVPGVRGGSGKTFDWTILAGLQRSVPLVLSGGLNPGNVAEAVRTVAPDWVDVASGVESAPGVKDRALMERFIAGARSRQKNQTP